MKRSQTPTFSAEGMMEAVPSWAVTTCACDAPSTTDCPPGLALGRAMVVAKVRLTPMTGLSAEEPSVTRMTSG